MSVLVTGSAGHLGEALVRRIRALGQTAVGVDRKPSPFTDQVGSIGERLFVENCVRQADCVVHAATLHKPHVVTHGWQDFIDTNVTGTLNLLEAAVSGGVTSFVFISSTSTFGSAINRDSPAAAVWVTEEVTPKPNNIYGVTKLMAENLCELVHRKRRLALVVLRTSRFFPEEDDVPEMRREYETANLQANELLYRRVDLEDAVSAVLLALQKAPEIGFGRYIISATTPFTHADLTPLAEDAPAVVRARFPECEALFRARGWKLLPRIDRVYVNDRARAELGWNPRCDFEYLLDCLRANRDFRSPLAREVGCKGYHGRSFSEGPYPVE
ncbi:MAG TPA: NAD(P)-dependent oxidoreductase [Sphingomicrobium sp.]|nr:NAD(P)-dependent oxidoreductase [Sphingomicrobium sp.]